MTTDALRVETNSPGETEELGALLSGVLPMGAFVALRGELGTGKTCLVRGMSRRYATGEIVSSPTYTIVNEYGGGPKLYHVDLYRLAGPEEVVDLGYEEFFEPSDGICVVEWADRVEGLLPEKRLDVKLEHGGGDRRILVLENRGVLEGDWRARVSGQGAP